jgi:nitroreductase
METIEAILTRRSIRHYTDQPIAKETIDILLTAAMYAPSASNKQPWHFVVIDDRDILNAIIEFHPHAKMLANAKCAILVCGDSELALAPGYIPVDCSAASQNILLAAHGMGLGACWLGIHPREERIAEIRKIIALPENIHPVSLISLGYPAKQPSKPERFDASRIHWNKF